MHVGSVIVRKLAGRGETGEGVYVHYVSVCVNVHLGM